MGHDHARSGAPVRGRADRRRTARRAARRRYRSRLRELPVISVVALAVALLLKTFLVQLFVIPSGSMQNTIGIGDRVVVDRFTPWLGSRPQRGDVVVFRDPGGWLEAGQRNASEGPVLRGVKAAFSFVGLLPSDSRQDLIKRVLGVGGDTVACCDDGGRVTVNGVAVDEPYLAPGNAPSQQPFRVTVPSGRLWVMGDHRDVSADSRSHLGDPGQGTVPVANVVGRAIAVAWPISHIQRLGAPSSLSSLPSAAGFGNPRRSATGDPLPAQHRPAVGVFALWPPARGRRPAVADEGTAACSGATVGC
ncbi:hypothetical protein GCM10009665_08590 [Kitasatospora nipponensis]|uniref:Signal peptidase I n=1 Tax=Kitasatospora nipponensis TaxID=258049 RepID=A0ABN1VRL3_9ACTN